MRDTLKNLIYRILKKKNLIDNIDIIEGTDGVDILYKVIHDQEINHIKCIITADNMEYMKGSEAIRILTCFNIKKIRKIPFIILRSFNEYYPFVKENMIDWIIKIMYKPCREKDLMGFFNQFKIFD